jgi:tRNA modification GTPase
MHFSVERSPDEKQAGLTTATPDLTAGDTIAAISTAAGEGAIAVVRMSGPNAVEIADKIFAGQEKPSQFASHVQHFGEIREGGELIDQVMLSVHCAPASYTGEDLVEISCHGGVLVSARLLEACLRVGARAARPGEFTERAFLNGKMDLTQAEAVIDLIRAKTDLALRSATEQLEGRLGQKIKDIRDALVSVLAHIEAAIDFPEEGINPDDTKRLAARISAIEEEIAALLRTADQGRILREGVRVVIYGPTNAGKSSLLNRLVGHERVIVSESHGTTRDTIEETINLDGLPLRLIDTAGFRDAPDTIEEEGMARTQKSLRLADIGLHIADRNAPRPAEFDRSSDQRVDIVILNKSDLPEHEDWKDSRALRISCATGEGFAELKNELIAKITRGNLHPENAMAINARHRECLRRALQYCQQASEDFAQSVVPEYVAVDVQGALRAIGQVIGSVDVEQVLDSVFGQFCIGK